METIASPIASTRHLRPARAALAELAPGILIAVKALIMVATLTALVVPAMGEFRGEAMSGRVLVYAMALLVIPAAWLVCGRRSYPVAPDSFLMVPLVFDLVGNSLHLYARFAHYDKVAHLVGVAAAAMSVAALLRRSVGGRVALAAVAVSGGLSIGIAIELSSSRCSTTRRRPGSARIKTPSAISQWTCSVPSPRPRSWPARSGQAVRGASVAARAAFVMGLALLGWGTVETATIGYQGRP